MPYYAIIDHILTESRLQIALLTLILGEIDGSKITWKIILSFAWLVPLSETVQYRRSTIKKKLLGLS